VAEPLAMKSAMILAGGLGTRLRSVVGDRPKVLAPVAGRRFLAYLLHQLADAGFEDCVLCTGYKGDQVARAFGERFRGVHLRYSQEESPLGTAGALRHAASLIRSETVVVLNGDSYCQADLGEFLGWHRERSAAASLILTEVEDISRFGAVESDAGDRVVRFGEKNGSGRGWINAGIYAISSERIARIPEGRAVSIEQECFPAWIGDGLFAYRGGRRFLDIGTPASFAEAQTFFSPAPDRMLGRRHLFFTEAALIEDGASLRPGRPEVKLRAGAGAALKSLQDRGLGLVLLATQPGGEPAAADTARFEAHRERLRSALGEEDVALDALRDLPAEHRAGSAGAGWEEGILERAAAEMAIDLGACFVAGVQAAEIAVGRQLGVTTVLLSADLEPHAQADLSAAGWAAAAEAILEWTEKGSAAAVSARGR